eukprot:TRINITY_DN5486_c0_g1_i1.p1 TRINITY_DN5486_c0_g1~~TRINITY_DN5486_c0_g1_i1.p1  ORF type:complete len:583 (-),score=165.26 TRINITY_DN5486_c0_g1_i1:50-1798(-)
MGTTSSKTKEKRLRDIEARRSRQLSERNIIESEKAERRKSTFVKNQREHLLQAACRGYLGRQALDRRRALAARRGYIAKEILSTEKTYVQSLRTLINLFYRPLKASASQSETGSPSPITKQENTASVGSRKSLPTSTSAELSVVRTNVRSMSVSSRIGRSMPVLPNFESPNGNVPVLLSPRSRQPPALPPRDYEDDPAPVVMTSPRRPFRANIPVATTANDRSPDAATWNGTPAQKVAKATPPTSGSDSNLLRSTSMKVIGSSLTTSQKSLSSSSFGSSMSVGEFQGDAPTIPGLQKDDVKQLFFGVEVIANYNDTIAVAFEERLANWEWRTPLSDIFLDMMAFLKTYINFVNNYNSALSTLQKLRKIPEFAAWLSETEKKPECKGNTIESFLIMPIQRIPRYVLLLEDLLKATPEDLSDRSGLEDAAAKMKSIASLVNEKKKESENFSKVVEIYNRLEPQVEDLCAPHRQFLMEGKIKAEQKDFVFYLFTDLLLMVKEKGDGKLKLKMHISLLTADIIDIHDIPEHKIKNSYQVVTPRKSLLVTAKSAEEKKLWTQTISNCKEQLEKIGRSRMNLSKSISE